MTDRKEELLSTFLSAFGGQLVNITTSVSVHVSDGEKSEGLLVNFEGIVLDKDELFVYLGDSISEITSCVKVSEIIHIEIKEEFTVVDQIFSNMPDPTKDEIN
jgi:hypothetical protein